MRTLTILKDKPENAERNEIAQTALRAARQHVLLPTEHGDVAITCIWDVRQK
jgi:hypothetical protein